MFAVQGQCLTKLGRFAEASRFFAKATEYKGSAASESPNHEAQFYADYGYCENKNQNYLESTKNLTRVLNVLDGAAKTEKTSRSEKLVKNAMELLEDNLQFMQDGDDDPRNQVQVLKDLYLAYGLHTECATDISIFILTKITRNLLQQQSFAEW